MTSPTRFLLAALVAASAAPAVRADRIDAKLNESAPAILAALNKQGVKNVGVLRFRAERGKKPESFDVGPINDGLAARVENLLVIHADRTNPIGVLKDPNKEAARYKLGHWYTNTAERKQLFTHAYPLAWGTTRVKPDAFLTGEVRCQGDMTKTTVVIEMFTAADPGKLVRVLEFTVATDRLVLADLGERFNAARRSAPKGAPKLARRSADLDRFAIGEARQRDGDPQPGDPQPEPPAGPAPSLPDIGGVTFQLLVADQPVTIQPSNSASAKWEVPSPAPGQSVTMALRNNTDKRLGVVLKVNELSTIFEQPDDSALCRKWVIEPGKEIKVRGFYYEDNKFAPFKILVGEEARLYIEQNQLGDKAGKIRVEVFAETTGDDEQLAISLPRRMSEARSAARRDLTTLKAELTKPPAGFKRSIKTETVNGKVQRREIMVPDEKQNGPELKQVDFKASSSPIAAELIQVVKQ